MSEAVWFLSPARSLLGLNGQPTKKSHVKKSQPGADWVEWKDSVISSHCLKVEASPVLISLNSSRYWGQTIRRASQSRIKIFSCPWLEFWARIFPDICWWLPVGATAKLWTWAEMLPFVAEACRNVTSLVCSPRDNNQWISISAPICLSCLEFSGKSFKPLLVSFSI